MDSGGAGPGAIVGRWRRAPRSAPPAVGCWAAVPARRAFKGLGPRRASRPALGPTTRQAAGVCCRRCWWAPGVPGFLIEFRPLSCCTRCEPALSAPPRLPPADSGLRFPVCAKGRVPGSGLRSPRGPLAARRPQEPGECPLSLWTDAAKSPRGSPPSPATPPCRAAAPGVGAAPHSALPPPAPAASSYSRREARSPGVLSQPRLAGADRGPGGARRPQRKDRPEGVPSFLPARCGLGSCGLFL